MILLFFSAFWWLFWVAVAYFGSRLDPVSDLVLVLVIIFVTSLFCGGLFQRRRQMLIKVYQPKYEVIFRISLFLLIGLFLLQVPTWILLIQNAIEEGTLAHNREILFLGNDLSNMQKLVFGVTSALIFNYLAISSIVFFHIYSKTDFLITTLVYLIFSSILKGARAEIYQFVTVSTIYLIGVYGVSVLPLLKKYKIPTAIILFSGLALLIFVSWLRDHDPFQGLIDYHTIGFVLLTKYMNGLPDFVEIGYSYGISYFGGVDYLIGLIIRFLYWSDFQSFTYAVQIIENDFLPTYTFESQIGLAESTYSLSGHNAFYTLLVTGYKSFGVYGVILMGMLFGFMIRRLLVNVKCRDVFSGFYLVLLIACVYMGIFSSFLETVGFWLTMILLNIVYHVTLWVDVKK